MKIKIQPRIETIIRRADGSVKESTVEVGTPRVLNITVEEEKPKRRKKRDGNNSRQRD
jgi:hypothetical protein